MNDKMKKALAKLNQSLDWVRNGEELEACYEGYKALKKIARIEKMRAILDEEKQNQSIPIEQVIGLLDSIMEE